MEYLFFGLLGVGFVFLGPIAFFLTLGARSRLDLAERKVRALEARISDAERRLVAQPIAAPSPESGPQAAAPETQTIAPRATGDEPTIVETPSEGQSMDRSGQESIQPTILPGAQPPEASAESVTALPGGAPAASDAPPADGGNAGPPIGAPARTARPSFEERLGTRWAVWIGGLALAVGAVLLVRQAIMQGWFGPGARIALGLAFAAALIAAGEWLRRREKGSGDVAQTLDRFNFARPSIPAMLTAAGTIGAFGSIYAAHALYDFIGPAVAFVALGVVGVAAMFAAGLHGPMLAGLGLAGALATPLMISSRTPSPWPVVIYIAVVVVAAYALARLRVWLWLALSGAVGAAVWSLLLIAGQNVEFQQAAVIHTALHVALALFVFCVEPWRGTTDPQAKIDPLASAVTLGAALLAFVVLASGATYPLFTTWIAGACVLVGLFAGSGVAALPAIAGVIASGFLVVTTMLVWRMALGEAPALTIPGLEDFEFARPQSPSAFAAFGIVSALGLTAACVFRLLRGAQLKTAFAAIYGGVAVVTPLLALIVAYLRLTMGATSTLYASLACALAAGFTFLAHLFRTGVRDGAPAAWNLGLGVFASAAIGALALGVVMVLDGGALTVALALAALGAAFVSVRLNIPILGWCVAGLGAAVAARYLWEPRISANIGTTPILNWLLFGYGVPAIAFGYAARLMRLARGEDIPVRIGEALAIMCSALLFFFEIRHFINGGDPYARSSSTIEIGLFTIVSLAFALVLMRLDLRRHSIVLNVASYVFAAGATLIACLGLGLGANPLFSIPVNPVEGGAVFNGLLLAYLLPGLMALLIARLADGLRPPWYVVLMRVMAVALIFGYLTLQVRRVFQGATIHITRLTSDSEWYAYSLVWLAFGVALLAYGLWRRSVEVRIASALFIVLSVVKVFLFDLSGLEGVLRALSFIGLGFVLIGIGLVYQKFVFVRKTPAAGEGAARQAAPP